MSQELINRQFQLERLSAEGKPLCEAIHRNYEEVLYQAETDELEELRQELAENTPPASIPDTSLTWILVTLYYLRQVARKGFKLEDAGRWQEVQTERQAKKREGVEK